MAGFNHSGYQPEFDTLLAERKRQARINMVLDCLDAGNAEAALKVWRASDSEIVLGDPFCLEDVMYAGLLAEATKELDDDEAEDIST